MKLVLSAWLMMTYRECEKEKEKMRYGNTGLCHMTHE